MIFVTVGTHEQQFNRLVSYMDEYAERHPNEEVVIQTGFSSYVPKNARWSKLYSYEQMQELVGSARIVITHGGPSSFIMPMQIGKIPIVVPRKHEFDEHVNNHQVMFCHAVAKRKKNIIVVDNVDKLEKILDNYERIVGKMTKGIENNNDKFCMEFEKIVCKLF